MTSQPTSRRVPPTEGGRRDRTAGAPRERAVPLHVRRAPRSLRAMVRALPGRLSALSVSHSKAGLYGAFVWARRALDGPFRWFRRGQGPGRYSCVRLSSVYTLVLVYTTSTAKFSTAAWVLHPVSLNVSFSYILQTSSKMRLPGGRWRLRAAPPPWGRWP